MIRTVTRCAHCGALELDGLEVDVQRREVRWQGRVAIGNRAELSIIDKLAEASGSVVRTGVIEQLLWGLRADGGPEYMGVAVRVRVSNARRLLNAIGAPISIKAEIGAGYYLAFTKPSAPATEPQMETADA